jgi:fructose-specific phosphotransferase system IIC component
MMEDFVAYNCGFVSGMLAGIVVGVVLYWVSEKIKNKR